MAGYFADTSYWMALSRKRDQHHRHAAAWNQYVIRTRSSIVTTESVLWEWLNGFSDASTRGVAAEGYRRVHAVMERRHLTEALTTDGHFEQASLKVMVPVQPPLGV